MLLQSLSNVHRYFTDGGDRRLDHWLLVHEPIYILCFIVGYLFIVVQGPKWMKNRKPFDLRRALIVYNFFLVALSGWMLYEFMATTIFNPAFNFWCQKIEQEDTSPLQMRQLNVTWWYFFSKIIEFMDTFFFILRKKDRQITFLHIYHHSSVLGLQWACIKWAPGGVGCLAGMFNCFIHVLMYGYYLLAAFGPHMQKYLWWKRYLTRLQITQFLIVFLHTTYALRLDCGFPRSFLHLLWLYMLTLFMLFSHFYTLAYTAKKEEQKTK